jgi:hypothetical protein
MLHVLFLLALASIAQPLPAKAAECSPSAAAPFTINPSTLRTLDSPDKKWQVLATPGKDFHDDGDLFISLADGHKKWRIDYYKRRGTLYFSDDSKYLIYRVEFLPIDTAIRAFDLTGSEPREIKHLDANIRKAISDKMPQHMAAEYVRYPEICFAAGDSSTFLLLSDTPIVPRWSRIKGTPFFTRIEVSLLTSAANATVIASHHEDPAPPPKSPQPLPH